VTLPSGATTVEVALDGSGSVDPDGTIVSFLWSGTPDPADVAQPTVPLGLGTHTFTLVVVDDAGASSTNGVGEPTPATDRQVTITVVEPADLACTKTGPKTVLSGTELTYAVTVANDGLGIATNVIVTDILPRGMTFDPNISDASCTESEAGIVTCSLGDLGENAMATVTIVGVVDDCIEENPIENMATVSSDDVGDPDSSNNACEARTLVEDKPIEGHFKIFAKGVGLNGSPSGDITLDIPGEPMQAFLTWQKNLTDGVNTIAFSNGSSIEEIPGNASQATGSNFSCFLADISAFIVTGSITYTVSTLDDEIYPGAGMLVIVEDPSFPLQRIEVQRDFCDFFFHGTEGHENSDVITFNFAPSETEREAKITLFVGDALSNNPPRGNEILLLADAGSPLSSLVNDPRCTNPADQTCITIGEDFGDGFPPGLVANDGNFWDTFQRDATIPEQATFASVQILSPVDRRGISAILSMAAFEIQLAAPPVCPPAD
jgi:uncharacterized repeat protein (TIGR01451 family)